MIKQSTASCAEGRANYLLCLLNKNKIPALGAGKIKRIESIKPKRRFYP